VIVEPWPEHRKSLRADLATAQQQWRELLQEYHPSIDIDAFEVYPGRLPTDIRHNSKIFREQLTQWLKNKDR